MEGRYRHINATIGNVFHKNVAKARVLMVGAGGIGCELLKNLVMCGFGDIEVVDLDTIDLSNLNRQFLFQRQHIGKAKAHVAKESALRFNPTANIKSHHASIYEPHFDLSWFKSFDLVLNALDNLAARRHVNSMCLAANVPLIESGTEGFRGQVTLHMKRLTRCYDCDGKPSRKTYPVCTIRSTPTAPIHCIVWAKSYLFSLLFGKTEEEDATINAEETSDNAEEMAHLQHEADALKKLKEAAGTDAYGRLVFEKVFTDDVKQLLKLDVLWKTRKPPSPLDYSVAAKGDAGEKPKDALQWDRKVWTLQENTRVFLDSLQELARRLIEHRRTDPEYALTFDKDDEASLNFVTATANLRAQVYGLEQKSRFEVKEMAGNIIPAVATTNAIIAGLIVLTAMKVLGGTWSECRNTWVANTINPERLDKPNPACAVCTTASFLLKINTETATLKDLLERVIKGKAKKEGLTKGLGILGEISIQEGDRLLYDEDFDDNLDLALKDLGIAHASRLLITNEDDDESNNVVAVNLYIEHRDNYGTNDDFFELSGDNAIPARPRKCVTATQSESNKRPLDDEAGPLENSKKRKVENERVEKGNAAVVILD